MTIQSDIIANEWKILCILLGFMGLARLYCRYLELEKSCMINQSYGLDLSFQPLAC